MNQNAGIFNGETNAIGWHAPLKQNSSIGVTGFGNLVGPSLNILTDNDWIDTSVLYSNALNFNEASKTRRIAGQIFLPTL
jgi:hypothetical protein